MYSVSDEFTAALNLSHSPTFKVEVLENGATVFLFDDGGSDDEGIVGGSITCDATAQVERSGHVTFTTRDFGIVPLLASDPLQPLGNELRVWRGIRLPTGVEWVPVVTGPMFNVTISRSGGTLTVDCDVFDRAKSLSVYAWDDVYSIAAGTNVATAILNILADRFPADVYASMIPEMTATAATTPLLVLGGTGNSDPGKDVADLATSAGLRFKFDRVGNPVLQAYPDPLLSDPVATYEYGTNMIASSRKLSADGVYSGVIVNGQSASTSGPFYAESWDDDTTSPTYYLGKFGRRPRTVNDPKVASNTSAQTSADALLTSGLGAVEQVQFSAVANPALDPLDIIIATDSDIGIDGRFVVSSFPVPLDVSSVMQITCRARNG